MKLLLIGLVIGANNLAASIALGAAGQAARWPRILLAFGVFEFCVPLTGIAVGREVASRLADYTGWLGGALLALLGTWIIIAGLVNGFDLGTLARRSMSWVGILLLAATLSIDNVVIGFSLGLRGYSPLELALTIATCSVVFSAVGLRIGDEGRRHFETIAEVSAGILLLGLAAADLAGWL